MLKSTLIARSALCGFAASLTLSMALARETMNVCALFASSNSSLVVQLGMAPSLATSERRLTQDRSAGEFATLVMSEKLTRMQTAETKCRENLICDATSYRYGLTPSLTATPSAPNFAFWKYLPEQDSATLSINESKGTGLTRTLPGDVSDVLAFEDGWVIATDKYEHVERSIGGIFGRLMGTHAPQIRTYRVFFVTSTQTRLLYEWSNKGKDRASRLSVVGFDASCRK